ncbi:MAG: sulfurtransferase TusA family protein [Candidatus Magnetobacterium sp. LHC-1]|uniref:Sulfurtransferase TusA family protein n=1 Tax=Candidatus Magnetobacterium casense TaxID=1455061 RepID=A0ABS6RVT4_9BACT|nr:sulfurtransferase TusA family protein [Candidatus Magnetobacterium casensis]MBF0607256.1 sulfurtransferase TusA family protein [Nitrospirota bacterium]MBV6340738.1 sulfurtransferase TusA family protein [Candidatus Magnetobacterium casensis]
MEDIIPNKRIDIRGLHCPYTFVKSKLAIETMNVGEVLEIVLDYQEASVSIPKSMQDHGHKVLKVDKVNDKDWILLIRKERE